MSDRPADERHLYEDSRLDEARHHPLVHRVGPVNAADVLNESRYDAKGYQNDGDDQADALLAHGEQGQGVTIRADGELVPELPDGHTRIDGKVYRVAQTKWKSDKRGWFLTYIVPVSADAGDTP